MTRMLPSELDERLSSDDRPFVLDIRPAPDYRTDAIEGSHSVPVYDDLRAGDEAALRDRLDDHGVETVVPAPSDREVVDEVIFDELTHGAVREESRATYLRVIDDLVDAGAQGVVLGCTEIELLVEQADRPAVPMFDTTALHVERAVEYSLGERPPGE